MDIPAPFNFNLDYETRDKLLKLEVDWEDKMNRVIKFEPCQVDILESLVNQKFINPQDRQNNSPTVKEILEFMRKHPALFVYGYAVSPKRRDFRISLEGLAVNQEDVTDELKEAFLDFCKGATEIHTEGVNGLLSWWA
ncbi:hypothetical protein ABE504_13255 [Paenibacillus oryzisoli]|uniref:hypothetical protein n=1 Tax=Paenibacillus oryzisoli TaxID=1850517 RepID=UPI003D2B7632